MSRLYLSARDVRTPAQASRTAAQAISEWQSTIVRNALGQHFRASARVTLRKPWWLPGPLYRALMRSVVIDSRWEQRR